MTGIRQKTSIAPHLRVAKNQANVRARLIEEGGKTLNTNLGGEANAALQKIIERGVTQREAVEYALMAYAKNLPPQPRRAALLSKGKP